MKNTLLITVSALTIIATTLVNHASGQQIEPFVGSINGAIEQAAKDNKLVFLNVTGLDPKSDQLAEQLLQIPEIVEYFNEKFITYRVDDRVKPEVLKKYAGSKPSYRQPIWFIDGKGRVISFHAMPNNPLSLFRLAKIATGEKRDHEAIYKAVKSNPTDLVSQQELLMDIPFFTTDLQGTDARKWEQRIKPLFNNYVEAKGLDSMINNVDFLILSSLHNQMTADDKIINSLIKNFDAYCDAITPQPVVDYITAMHIDYTIRLARAGDTTYISEINRITGDLRNVYTFVNMDPETMLLPDYRALNDANYAAYAKKDTELYLSVMNKYLESRNPAKTSDYLLALNTLRKGAKKSVTKAGYLKCVEWISKAIEDQDMSFAYKMDLLIEMGDCFVAAKDYGNARNIYNQVNDLVTKTTDIGYKAKMGRIISEKLTAIE